MKELIKRDFAFASDDPLTMEIRRYSKKEYMLRCELINLDMQQSQERNISSKRCLREQMARLEAVHKKNIEKYYTLCRQKKRQRNSLY